MKTKILSLLVVVLASFSSCTAQTDGYTDVSVNDLKAKLSEDIIVLDVRTPGEIAQGFIGNPQFIDFNKDNFMEEAMKLPRDKPIYVYCAVGGRSSMAADKLAKKGYTNIFNVDGGIKAWQKQGFELNRK